MALKRASKRSNAIITLTTWSKLEIARILRYPIGNIIPVAFSHRSSSKPDQCLKGNASKPYVLILGHLERRKNIGTIIRAAAESNWPEGVGLVIAGEDHGERRSLEQIAANLDVNVSFAGPVSDEEKEDLLSNAVCLVMPSFLEGFGIPVAEAVSLGVPALVSDQTALPEVVGVERAVIPALDTFAWANKVRELATDPHTREQLLTEELEHQSNYSSNSARTSYLQCLRD